MIKKILYLYSIVLQILDGILTYIGVTQLGYGSKAEGNPIIKYFIDTLGAEFGLIITKCFAIFIIWRFKHLFGIKSFLFICGIYTVVVFGWVYILLSFH
jgi:uncharacterized membrane protein